MRKAKEPDYCVYKRSKMDVKMVVEEVMVLAKCDRSRLVVDS